MNKKELEAFAREAALSRHSIFEPRIVAKAPLDYPWKSRVVIYIRCPLMIYVGTKPTRLRGSGRWVYRTVTNDCGPR